MLVASAERISNNGVNNASSVSIVIVTVQQPCARDSARSAFSH